MPATMPEERPRGKEDFTTLRWDVRSDGRAGFVFVNNYQRLQPMPPKSNVQFAIHLPAGSFTFPEKPVTVPADACFFWPFNFDLGQGVQLAWATAQPVTAVNDGKVRTIFFAQTPDIPAEFAFNHDSGLNPVSGRMRRMGNQWIVDGLKPDAGSAFQISGTNGSTLRIVLLSDRDSLCLWKGPWQGQDRAFLTRARLMLDGTNLCLTSTNRDDLNVGIYPCPPVVLFQGKAVPHKADGVFEKFRPPRPRLETDKVRLTETQPAGPLRKIVPGRIAQPVAEAPDDAAFGAAAIWKINLPAGLDLKTDPILRLHYVGDVARVALDGRLLIDDFYNGDPMDIGLRRYAPEILNGDLEVAILPLQKSASIDLAKTAQPDFGGKSGVVLLNKVEIIPRYQVQLNGR